MIDWSQLKMSDLNTQGASAVAEIVKAATSSPEVAEHPISQGAETGTQQESSSDVAVTGFELAEGVSTEEQAIKVAVPKVFSPRANTNITVHRRTNPDGSFEFILTDEDSSWMRKNENFITAPPIGVEATEELLALLTEETHEYFNVLDSDADKSSLGDHGDITNLTKLKTFSAEHGGLLNILITGIRSITVSSRLLQKAMNSDAPLLNGAMTIAYQVDGQEGVMKYRLVGQITHNLVAKIAQVSGEDLLRDLQKAAEAKPKKAKQKKIAAKVEEVQESKPVDFDQQQPDFNGNASAVALATGAVERRHRENQQRETEGQLAKAHKQQQQQHQQQMRAAQGVGQDVRRLIEMVEILVQENRDMKRQLSDTKGLANTLQRELNSNRAVIKELLETNKGITDTLSTILDALIEK